MERLGPWELAENARGCAAALAVGSEDSALGLIQRGLDPNERPGAFTLFELAVRGKAPRAAGALLAAGLGVESRSSMGLTPLMLCALETDDPLWLALAARLLAQGADPNARCPRGESALAMGCAGPGALAIAKILLAAGADPRARNEWGQSALHLAVEADQADAARALLEAGALVDEPGGDGATPLECALERSGSGACAEVLLEFGADPGKLPSETAQMARDCAGEAERPAGKGFPLGRPPRVAALVAAGRALRERERVAAEAAQIDGAADEPRGAPGVRQPGARL